MLFGKAMLIRLQQPSKPLFPKDVMPFGNVMLVRLLQPLKQLFPKDVMLLGKVIPSNLLQKEYPLMVDYQCFDSDTIGER